ncbi:GH18028 [Drosophila grimshawi]|uniref:GH18028 n=2 Tax=Drosophila grimshawi TaxID=7222 RepID=B4JHS2_DROGR|nr:GH18028 [Drosophila grimshawi]
MRVKKVDFQKKYTKLKSRVKNFVFENASIVDEVCALQVELAAARSERLTLIERLMFHEGLDKSSITQDQLLNENRDNTKKYVASTPNHAFEKKNESKSNNIPALQQKSFPLKLTNVLIHSIGEIIPTNPNFHTAHWIYPVGYVATRIYAHPRDPVKKCVFTCKILNNAGLPQFQLIPDNDLDGVFFGETANICHQELLNCIQSSSKQKPVHVKFKAKGEVFFGLANQKVQSLLLADTRIKQCTKFKGYLLENNKEILENDDPTLSYTSLQTYLNQ